MKWGRGEYADAHIIEDFTDFTRSLERQLAVALEEINNWPHESFCINTYRCTCHKSKAIKRIEEAKSRHEQEKT